MKIKAIVNKLDEMRIFQKRFETINISKFRDKSKIIHASNEIDNIRKKVKRNNKSMTEYIRNWRDSRYGPSSS